MALNPGIPSFFIVRDTAWTVRRTLTMSCIGSLLVSGHGVQIKDTNGDEVDGLDECLLLSLLGGMPVTNGILLGICAIDYRGDDPRPTCRTTGLIVDDVSYVNNRILSCQSVPLISSDHA